MMFHSEITELIIGALFAVHNQLGNQYQEKYYQRALEIELKNRKLKFEREKQIPIFYLGKKIGSHALDFIVEDKVIVELKAIPGLSQKDVNQLIRYLNYVQKRVGILANFGKERLEFKRILLPDKYLTSTGHQF